MNGTELANAAWWASFWEQVEHWAFLLVVVSLAVEFAALKLGTPYKEKLNAAREERISTANERAAKAELELAKFKAPRMLDQEQQNNIAEQVRQFSGTEFDTGLPTGDAECAQLMLAIESALTNGGWTQIDWQGSNILLTHPNKPAAGLVAVTNIIIAVYPDQFSQLGAAAEALESALNENGIAK